MQFLQQDTVSDDDVLAVLRLWYFKQNKTRANVTPEGSTSVFSDNLGLVKTRVGTVLCSNATVKNWAVLVLFSRWLAEHLPSCFQTFFPFSSVSVNFAYAARRHRDSYNVGPSVVKAFGSFTGGELLYWPEDNGNKKVEALEWDSAQKFDARRELVLFSGLRGHAVAPFVGERYSLVFFTSTEYEKASEKDVSFLKHQCCIPWPSEDNLNYYKSLLAPCRAGNRSIRHMFGYSEKPSALQIGGTSATVLGETLSAVLSFVMTPVIVADICACGKRLRDACLTIDAWSGCVVNTDGLRPLGRRAQKHFRLFTQARYVISGKWCQGNVALMLSNFKPWRWEIEERASGLSVNISSKLPQADARFFLPEPRHDLFVAFVSCQTARTFATAVRKGIKQKVSHGFRCEEGSAAFCINNEELFWQPVAVPLNGLVRGQHRNGQFELSWDGAYLSVPCGEVGRRFALASEKSFVALPCW